MHYALLRCILEVRQVTCRNRRRRKETAEAHWRLMQGTGTMTLQCLPIAAVVIGTLANHAGKKRNGNDTSKISKSLFNSLIKIIFTSTKHAPFEF